MYMYKAPTLNIINFTGKLCMTSANNWLLDSRTTSANNWLFDSRT